MAHLPLVPLSLPFILIKVHSVLLGLPFIQFQLWAPAIGALDVSMLSPCCFHCWPISLPSLFLLTRKLTPWNFCGDCLPFFWELSGAMFARVPLRTCIVQFVSLIWDSFLDTSSVQLAWTKSCWSTMESYYFENFGKVLFQ